MSRMLAHHGCPSCGRIQLDEFPLYVEHWTIAERLRAMSELYDPKHVEGDCTWCTDVGAARLMRQAADALEAKLGKVSSSEVVQ